MTSEQREWQIELALRLLGEVVLNAFDESEAETLDSWQISELTHLHPLAHSSRFFHLVADRLESEGWLTGEGPRNNPSWSIAPPDEHALVDTP